MIPEPLARLLALGPSFFGVGGFEPADPLIAALTGELGAAAVLDLAELDTPQDPVGPGPAVVLVRTYSDLQRAVHLRGLLPSGRRLVVAVADMAPAHRPTSVRLPPGRPWTSLRELRLLRGPGAFWRADARLDEPAPLGTLLRSVTRAPRLGTADRAALDWTAGAHAVRLGAIDTDATDTDAAADLVARTGLPAGGRVRAIELPRPRTDPGLAAETLHTAPGSVPLPPVDEHTVNPTGFTADASGPHALMSYQGGGWVVHADAARPHALPTRGPVTDADVAALRRLRSVGVDWDTHPGTLAGLHAVASLAAAGIPLHSKTTAPLWAIGLSRELRSLLDRARPQDFDDPTARELHSIRGRRAALRDHSGRAHLTGLGLPAADPAVSVLLCTRRPGFLPAILAQIAAQRHADLETVLVLHGITRDAPGIAKALKGFDRPLTVIEAPADEVFGSVLNRGAAAAAGEYVTKFDDDDWYSPHHIPDLLQASRYANADVTGVQSELVHLEELGITVRRTRTSEDYTDHLSGGTLLFRRDFFQALGGYRPLPTGEDRGLLEDTADAGGAIYKTHGLGYVLSRHSSGHTWTAETPYFLRGNVGQWPGNLGPAVAADELEPHISSERHDRSR